MFNDDLTINKHNSVKNGLPADDHSRGIQSVDDRHPAYSSQAGLSHSIVLIIRAALRYSDKWQVLRVTNYSETIYICQKTI